MGFHDLTGQSIEIVIADIRQVAHARLHLVRRTLLKLFIRVIFLGTLPQVAGERQVSRSRFGPP